MLSTATTGTPPPPAEEMASTTDNNNKQSASSSPSSSPSSSSSSCNGGVENEGGNQQEQNHLGDQHETQQQNQPQQCDDDEPVSLTSPLKSTTDTISSEGGSGEKKSPMMTQFEGEKESSQQSSSVRPTATTSPTEVEDEKSQDVDVAEVSTTANDDLIAPPPRTVRTTTLPMDNNNNDALEMSNDASIEAVLLVEEEETYATSPPQELNNQNNSADSTERMVQVLKDDQEEVVEPAASTTFPFSPSLSEESARATPSLAAAAATVASSTTAVATHASSALSSVSTHAGTAITATSSRDQQQQNESALAVSFLESSPEAQQVAQHFATEHKIFLKAALTLLTDRDRHAPTVGMMDPVVLKSGPLRKASHLMNGVWKVKYVEIRRGMFSYYENVAKEGTPGQLRRKNIPLDAGYNSGGGDAAGGGGGGGGGGGANGLNSGGQNHHRDGNGNNINDNHHQHHCPTTCRAVRLHEKAFLKLTVPGQSGAMFELSVNGQKRLWMAKSRAERAVWMQAIENAMVGGSVTGYNSTRSSTGSGGLIEDLFDHRGKIRHVSPRSPFRNDLRLFLRLQSYLRSIHTKTEYIDGLREVMSHPIRVPVKWIAKQALLSENQSAEGNHAFLEQEVDLSVEQLWRDLQRDSVCIDGKVYRGDHPSQGPERILGALMRCILQTAVACGGDGGGGNRNSTDWTQAQALSFARDILLSGNRTRSGGDSYFCINSLFKHPELVVVVPSGLVAEPVSITVSQDESDLSLNAKSGWIQTRSSKLQRSWKKFFFVLSEGMLTHYEGSAPRPHGLRGQLAMTDACISVARRQRTSSSSDSDTYFVVTIVAKDGKERLLRFENEDRVLDWTYALEAMARAKFRSNDIGVPSKAASSSEQSSTPAPAAARRLMRRRSQDDASSNQNNGNNATTPTSTAPAPVTSTLAEQIMETHGRNLGISVDKVRERLALRSRKTSAAVRVLIQAVTDYKICTTDPEGDEQLDTWGNVRTQFEQSFRLSGGPSGFISRGEEIVLVTVIDCINLQKNTAGGADGEEAQQMFQQQQQQQQQQQSSQPANPPSLTEADVPLSPGRRQPRKSRMFRQFNSNDDLGTDDR